MPVTHRCPERETDGKFWLLFEDHPQPMWVLDRESMRFLAANAAACSLYGYSPEEFRAMAIAEIQRPEDARRFAEELRAPQRPASGAWRHRARDGHIVDVEIAVRDIEFDGRKAELATLMDIGGRRRLEDQLRQAQKMEAVGMLAGGIAHDFNNLLTIIAGYSQLILNSLDEDDPNRQPAEQIMKAGERAAALTRQLLAFSRSQVLQPKVLDLNKLVTSLNAMLQRLIGEDIDLRLALQPDLGRVNADPGQVEQVLMNLVVNSRDAMPKGGSLAIETSNILLDQPYPIRHLTLQPGWYVRLTVKDTGSGMDAATRARLFEPFFTTKGSGKGTGLGLSTVFSIVRKSGGNVDVHSEPGRGTAFQVYLPRIDEPASVEPEDRKTRAAAGTETILLAEDDETVRVLVRETLEREGYKVLDAADPVEARRLAERFQGAIDLLITDVVMPKVSGRELAEALSRQRPAMKILYMSGYTDSAIVNTGVLQKEVAFLQKPFTPAALAGKVREVLEANDTWWRAAE
jgi:two-component system, cell cycle sensor histidine kinase and response regulator CckA